MTGKKALEYVKDLCCKIDGVSDTLPLRRMALTLVIPTAALASACYVDPPYGVPWDDDWDNGTPEICSDRMDNDGDGDADCDDSECATTERCLGCFDGVDNDGDGAADCSDAACADGEGCVGRCDDGVDNDGDGFFDCDDDDCEGSPDCS